LKGDSYVSQSTGRPSAPAASSLERYKKIAKALAKACSSADPDAIADWSEEWVEIIVKLSGVRITPQLPVCIQSWID